MTFTSGLWDVGNKVHFFQVVKEAVLLEENWSQAKNKNKVLQEQCDDTRKL